jgi:hypothetical protein
MLLPPVCYSGKDFCGERGDGDPFEKSGTIKLYCLPPARETSTVLTGSSSDPDASAAAVMERAYSLLICWILGRRGLDKSPGTLVVLLLQLPIPDWWCSAPHAV